MKAIGKILLVLGSTAFCAACGSSGGNSAAPPPPPPPPPVTPPTTGASLGGIWVGVDGVGVDIIVLVTESGRFQYINEFFDQGSGVMAVGSGNNVSSDFQLVTALGATFADGTTLADCTLSGTVTERQTLAITVQCSTTAGGQIESVVSLSYNTLYERDSSLSVVAGNYDDAGLTLNIDANGVMFEQDPASGCITDGQFNVIDPDFNVYDVEFGFSSCTGQATSLNGTNFVGMATLDNTVSPEALMTAVMGDVAGTLAGLFGIAPRL